MGIETAAISAGGSLLGGAMGGKGAKSAAKTQANAANNAANLSAQAFLHTNQQLAPYNAFGQSVLPQYQGGLNALYDTTAKSLTPLTQSLYGIGFPTGAVTSGGNVPSVSQTINASANPLTSATTTMGGFTPFDYQSWGLGADQQAALEATPGYQFTRNQGLQGVQNSAAATGRGVSGNALAGAANYATGLADATYGQQFQRAMEGQNLAFGQQLSGENQAFNQSLASNNQWLNQLQQAFAQDLGAGQFDLSAQNQQFTQQLQHAQALQQRQQQIYTQTQAGIYNPLSALLQGVNLGQSSAAMVGNNANNAANSINNNLMSGAASTAAGQVGAANAMQGALGGASNALTNYLMFSQMGLIPTADSQQYWNGDGTFA